MSMVVIHSTHSTVHRVYMRFTLLLHHSMITISINENVLTSLEEHDNALPRVINALRIFDGSILNIWETYMHACIHNYIIT